jgi:hypothetical protein
MAGWKMWQLPPVETGVWYTKPAESGLKNSFSVIYSSILAGLEGVSWAFQRKARGE